MYIPPLPLFISAYQAPELPCGGLLHLFIRTQVGVLHPSMTLIQRSAGFSRQVPGIQLKEGYNIDLSWYPVQHTAGFSRLFPGILFYTE
jgi:hypothetical protein